MSYPCVFSEDRRHRMLWRAAVIPGLPHNNVPGELYRPMMVIGLNPSTADEDKPDPTVRRCMTFARDWGASHLVMTNLFTFRATDPFKMLKVHDPVHMFADSWLYSLAGETAISGGIIVCAWGNHGLHMQRGRRVRQLLRGFGLHHWRMTRSGEPAHPLYLPGYLKPIPLPEVE